MVEKQKRTKLNKDARIEIRISPTDKELLALRAKEVDAPLSTYVVEVLKIVDPQAIKIRQEIVNELINLSNCLEENNIEGAKGCVNKLWKNI